VSLVGIIIAAGIAVAAILFGLQSAQTLPEAVVNALTESFKYMVDKFLFFLAAILPLLAIALPLYILRSREEEIIIFGALYGLGLGVLTIMLGLQNQVIDMFRTSWYGGWTSGLLPEIAGVVYAMFYYLIGAFLYFVDGVLSVLIGLASPAEWLRGKVRKARSKWRRWKR